MSTIDENSHIIKPHRTERKEEYIIEAQERLFKVTYFKSSYLEKSEESVTVSRVNISSKIVEQVLKVSKRPFCDFFYVKIEDESPPPSGLEESLQNLPEHVRAVLDSRHNQEYVRSCYTKNHLLIALAEALSN